MESIFLADITDRDHVSTDEQRQLLCDQVGKVNQRGSIGRVARQHQNLHNILSTKRFEIMQIILAGLPVHIKTL